MDEAARANYERVSVALESGDKKAMMYRPARMAWHAIVKSFPETELTNLAEKDKEIRKAAARLLRECIAADREMP